MNDKLTDTLKLDLAFLYKMRGGTKIQVKMQIQTTWDTRISPWTVAV